MKNRKHYTKDKQEDTQAPPAATQEDTPRNITKIGNISGGKGFAIGPGARSMVVEIESLFNLDVLLGVLKRNWLFIVVTTFLQLALLALWLFYKNRFLIPVQAYCFSAILLETSIAAGTSLLKKTTHQTILAVAILISTTTNIGLISAEIYRILHPPKFNSEVFGIAVAQFGEGPDFKNTPRAREVNQLVLQQLKKQVKENPDLSFVQFQSIGLIKTQEQAWTDGSRVGADLVIWGQLQESENQTILSFSILETPDKVSNPMFARVLPLYDMTATSFFKIDSQESEEITKGTTTISSFTFGLAHFFKWDFVSATEAFDEAMTATSANQEDGYHYLIYLYNGLSLQEMWKLEEANQYFDKAIQIHPDDPAPWLARAYGYRSLGKIEEAQQDARKAWELCSRHIHIKPDNYVTYFDRAQANEILEDWNSALADYQTTKEKAPDLYIAYIGLARIQIILDLLPEAERTIQEGIKLAESKDANPAWAYVYLAHILQMEGDSNQARIAFEKAADLAPDVDYMHLRLGQFLEDTGDPGDLTASEEEYKKSIAVSNNKASAHVDLARFFARHDRLNEAITEYHSALQYDRQAAGTWIELAELLTRLNRYNEARETFKIAVETDPEYPYSYLSFGNFLYNLGEYESAIKEWESARQTGYNACGLFLNIGQAYELLGDQDQAIILYREAFNSEAEQNLDCQNEAIRRLANFSD